MTVGDAGKVPRCPRCFGARTIKQRKPLPSGEPVPDGWVLILEGTEIEREVSCPLCRGGRRPTFVR